MKHYPHLQQNKKNAAAENELYKVITLLKNPEEVRRFLQDLCTPAELQALADRWRVVKDIKADKPYRQIHAETEVSVTTIGRVARCLLLGEGGYNLVFERLKKLKE